MMPKNYTKVHSDAKKPTKSIREPIEMSGGSTEKNHYWTPPFYRPNLFIPVSITCFIVTCLSLFIIMLQLSVSSSRSVIYSRFRSRSIKYAKRTLASGVMNVNQNLAFDLSPSTRLCLPRQDNQSSRPPPSKTRGFQFSGRSCPTLLPPLSPGLGMGHELIGILLKAFDASIYLPFLKYKFN